MDWLIRLALSPESTLPRIQLLKTKLSYSIRSITLLSYSVASDVLQRKRVVRGKIIRTEYARCCDISGRSYSMLHLLVQGL